VRSTRKPHTDGHERGGNENAHAPAEGRDIWGTERRLELTARSSPVSHQLQDEERINCRGRKANRL
jgi:hypothetical protein